MAETRVLRYADGLSRAAVLGVGLIAVLGVAAGVLAVWNPRLTLVVAVLSLVLVLALTRLDVALMLALAAGPLEAAVGDTSGLLTPAKLMMFISVVGFLLNCLATGRELRFDRVHLVVVLLLAVTLLSSLFARVPEAAAATTARYAGFAALFFVITQVADSPRVLRNLIWALSAASALAAGLGLWNYLTETTEFAQLPYHNQNDFAFILATTLPLTLWLAGGTTRRSLRIVAIAMSVGMAVAIVLSFSRGALAGLAIAVAVAMVLRPRVLRLAVGGLLAAAAGLLVIYYFYSSLLEQSLELKQHIASYNVATRLDAWGAAARLIADHPAFGIGPGNFRHVFFEATGRLPGTENLYFVHNAFLDVGAELGLMGLALFIAYFAVVFVYLGRVQKGEYGPPRLPFAIGIAMVAAGGGALFLSEQYFPPIWVLGGFGCALWIWRDRMAETRVAPHAVEAR